MAKLESIFKALSDPTRLKIVSLLATKDELCVCHIMENIDMTQPAISHHLAILKNAMLVKSRKQGQWMYYALNKNVLADTIQQFLDNIMQLTITSEEENYCCLNDKSLGDKNE